MIFDILRGNFTKWDLITLLVSIPIVLISLSFHEFAHGWMADRLGDKTARWNGRLTMNPLRHLDPIGAFSMLFFGIGWAKPVPINPRNFKNPKKGMALTGLAGPVSNLLLSFIGILCYRILNAVTALNILLKGGSIYYYSNASFSFFDILAIFFIMFSTMNAYLAVFNLIPVPPFDGSRIFYFILPDKWYFSVMKYERVMMVIMLALLFTGVLSPVLSAVSGAFLSAFDFIIGLVPFL